MTPRRTRKELFGIVYNALIADVWITPHQIAKKTGLDIRTVYHILTKWNWASHTNFQFRSVLSQWVGLAKIELAYNEKRIFAVKKLKEILEG